MPSIINTNIMSLNSQKNLNRSQSTLSTSLQRLSSGLRINSAKDDAAGLAISERFSSQIRGLTVASRNANDGISLSQVAEGALEEVGTILQRVRELAVQSANATNSSSDRQALQLEVGQLTAELNRIAKSSDFNGQKILDGTFTTALFQVGANANETIVATTSNFKTDQYGDYRISGHANHVSSVSTGRFATATTAIISGSQGTQTINIAASSSAKSVAAQVNLVADLTNVKASAVTQVELSFDSSGTYRFALNGDNTTAVEIGFNISASTGVEQLAQAAQAFNDQQAKTGVVAAVKTDGSGITLSHYEGTNITLKTVSGTANAASAIVRGSVGGAGSTALVGTTTVSSAYVTGQVTFDSTKSFTIDTTTASFLLSGSANAASLQKVSDLDISSVSGANLALSIVDSAIAQVSNQRAKFGALQNRFASTIRNLETSVENLSGARSRIRDADFAVETAELTRSQILQQAGTAMLAQANSIPQNVLSLLQ